MWARVKRWALGVAAGAFALLYVLLQLALGAARDDRQKARAERERADTAEALRQLERNIQAARGAAQEKSRETEQAMQKRQAADDRPAVFGDQRLHDRQNRL